MSEYPPGIEPEYLLADVEGSDHTHAVPRTGRVTLCGLPVFAPSGGTSAPTCPDCRRELGAPEYQEKP